MMPFISIIIPVFNVERYLNECLNSVRFQLYENFEVLLINDGSTDTSGIICDKFSLIDKRFRVFHKENGGAGSARNLGIKYAVGKWICFIDSDDYVLPCYLKSFVDSPRENLIDLVINGLIKKAEKKIDLGEGIISSKDYKNLFETKKVHTFGYIASKFFKREIILKNNISFPENFTIAEDLAFSLRYIAFSRLIKFESIHQYYYRNVGNSKSNKFENPDICFNRYFFFKNFFKNEFSEIYNPLFSKEFKYVSLKKNLGSILFQCILSLYLYDIIKKIRLDHLKKLDDSDKSLILFYKSRLKNPIFIFTFFLLNKGEIKLADFLLKIFFFIRNLSLKLLGFSIIYKIRK